MLWHPLSSNVFHLSAFAPLTCSLRFRFYSDLLFINCNFRVGTFTRSSLKGSFSMYRFIAVSYIEVTVCLTCLLLTLSTAVCVRLDFFRRLKRTVLCWIQQVIQLLMVHCSLNCWELPPSHPRKVLQVLFLSASNIQPLTVNKTDWSGVENLCHFKVCHVLKGVPQWSNMVNFIWWKNSITMLEDCTYPFFGSECNVLDMEWPIVFLCTQVTCRH